jgi:hypothetical protein
VLSWRAGTPSAVRYKSTRVQRPSSLEAKAPKRVPGMSASLLSQAESCLDHPPIAAERSETTPTLTTSEPSSTTEMRCARGTLFRSTTRPLPRELTRTIAPWERGMHVDGRVTTQQNQVAAEGGRCDPIPAGGRPTDHAYGGGSSRPDRRDRFLYRWDDPMSLSVRRLRVLTCTWSTPLDRRVGQVLSLRPRPARR